MNVTIIGIWIVTRGGFRTAATSKMERFVIIVNGFQPLTIIIKRSILDVAAVLHPPLVTAQWFRGNACKSSKLGYMLTMLLITFYLKIFIADSILHFEIVENSSEELVEHPVRVSKVYLIAMKASNFCMKKNFNG